MLGETNCSNIFNENTWRSNHRMLKSFYLTFASKSYSPSMSVIYKNIMFKNPKNKLSVEFPHYSSSFQTSQQFTITWKSPNFLKLSSKSTLTDTT